MAQSTGPDLLLPAYLSAGAAAAIGLGVGFLFVRNNHIQTFNDDSECLVGPGTRGDNCRDDLDAANRAETVMTAAFIGGGVLAAIAGTLLLIDVLDGEPGAPAVVGPGPGDAGLSFETRF